MGHMLATGTLDSLAFLANFNQNHWVAVVLEFKNDIIWYGDSLGGKIPLSMEKNIKWWTKFHSGKDFTVKKLTITIQKDFFSCCLLVWNAICVFVFPETTHLIPAKRVAEERLKMLVQILYQHQAKDDVRNTYLLCFYLTMLQLPENLEDEYTKDVNMADNLNDTSIKEKDYLMGEENHSDNFKPDDAMETDSDCYDDSDSEMLPFGSADSPPTRIQASVEIIEVGLR